MAMKAGFEDRNRILGDPQFVQVPLDWMLSKDRAQEWREFIDGKTDFGRRVIELEIPLFILLRGNHWLQIESAKKTIHKDVENLGFSDKIVNEANTIYDIKFILSR